jgi:hypothetical protein
MSKPARVMVEVTNLETGVTRYITCAGYTDAETPALVAAYALRYAEGVLSLPTEVVPHKLALWPGGDEQDDDAA